MNDYEAKLERRKARLLGLAQKVRDESNRRLAKADEIAKRWPMGQPILVGHHSEKRHRRDLAQVEANMVKGLALEKTAKRLELMAEAVGKGGVSSDDPQAVDKLRERVIALEEEHLWMKRANGYFRLKKSLYGFQGPQEILTKGESNLKIWGALVKVPFPSYALSNSKANLRRLKHRIQDLAAAVDAVIRPEINGEGFSITEDKSENRILLRFNQWLSKDNYKFIRHNGWLWASSKRAFVRKLNNAGRGSADYLARVLPEKLSVKGQGQAV